MPPPPPRTTRSKAAAAAAAAAAPAPSPAPPMWNRVSSLAGNPATTATPSKRRVVVQEGGSTPAPVRGKLSIAQYVPDKEPIKTYLRVRNPPERPLQKPYLSVLSPTEIELKQPSSAAHAAHPRLSSAPHTHQSQALTSERYAFTHVFSPFPSPLPASQTQAQSEFFKQTTLPLLYDVLQAGQNALLFAYGVTSSGKTYTIQGGQGRGEEGVIPRAIDVVFNSVGELRAGPEFRPSKVCGVESTKTSSTILGIPRSNSHHTESFADVFPGGPPPPFPPAESTSIPLDRNYKYSVWISYAEVYNEKIYDLLESLPTSSSSSMNASSSTSSGFSAASSATSSTASAGSKKVIVVKRKALSLRADRDADAKYVDGLREVRCDSPEEARALLELGTHNRQVFSTLANRQSSRSHSIFNIRIMRVHGGSPKDPDSVTTSRLSIVDLAGSERTKNTGNTGDRLREAGNINKSLMVLGQCMETLRRNQRRPEGKKPEPVPFRHSKLTELFQSFFVGDGKAVMMVHCNPYDTSYEENSHVMKFSAVARDVTVLARPPPMPNSMLPRRVPTFKGALRAIREGAGALGGGSTPRKPAAAPSATATAARAKAGSTANGLKDRFVNVEVGDVSVAMQDEPDTDTEDDGSDETVVAAVAPEEKAEDEDESDDERDPFTEFLFAELQEMKQKWIEAEMRCAEIEALVREECAEQMREALRKQEAEWAERLQDEAEQNEINTNRKIELVNQLHAAAERRRLAEEAAEAEEEASEEEVEVEAELDENPSASREPSVQPESLASASEPESETEKPEEERDDDDEDDDDDVYDSAAEAHDDDDDEDEFEQTPTKAEPRSSRPKRSSVKVVPLAAPAPHPSRAAKKKSSVATAPMPEHDENEEPEEPVAPAEEKKKKRKIPSAKAVPVLDEEEIERRATKAAAPAPSGTGPVRRMATRSSKITG